MVEREDTTEASPPDNHTTEGKSLKEGLKSLDKGQTVKFSLYDPDEAGRLEVKGKVKHNTFGVIILDLDGGEKDYELSHDDVKSFKILEAPEEETIDWNFKKGSFVTFELHDGGRFFNRRIEEKGEKDGREYIEIGNTKVKGLRPFFRDEMKALKVKKY